MQTTAKKILPGLALCLGIALPAWALGKAFPVIGGPVFAILIGMVIALFYKDKRATQAGITYTLQAAATLGAEFADVADASAVSADAGDVIELKAPATAEMQFFRVKASN